MKTITVANRKGGSGKSTLAAHLSIEATKVGLKTILIDLDPQQTLENWWEKREQEAPYLTEADPTDLPNLQKSLSEKGFDLCIIDTPGDTSINASAGIKAANLVVIPSKPTSPDLSAIGRTIQFVKSENKDFIFVVSQAVANSNAALQAASVLSEFGPVAPASIINRAAYYQAMAIGESAADMNSGGLEEMTNVWNYIANKLGLFQKAKKVKVA